MKVDLIDEYIITVTSNILGAGISLFKEQNPQIALTLQESKRFGQFVQLHHKVVR